MELELYVYIHMVYEYHTFPLAKGISAELNYIRFHYFPEIPKSHKQKPETQPSNMAYNSVFRWSGPGHKFFLFIVKLVKIKLIES